MPLLDGPPHDYSDRPGHKQQAEPLGRNQGPVPLLGIPEQPHDRPWNIEKGENHQRPSPTFSKAEPCRQCPNGAEGQEQRREPAVALRYRLYQSEATDDETDYHEEQAHTYQYPLRG